MQYTHTVDFDGCGRGEGLGGDAFGAGAGIVAALAVALQLVSSSNEFNLDLRLDDLERDYERNLNFNIVDNLKNLDQTSFEMSTLEELEAAGAVVRVALPAS